MPNKALNLSPHRGNPFNAETHEFRHFCSILLLLASFNVFNLPLLTHRALLGSFFHGSFSYDISREPYSSEMSGPFSSENTAKLAFNAKEQTQWRLEENIPVKYLQY